MTLAFLINQTHKEEQNCTTSILAFEALSRGHTVWYIGVGDFLMSRDKTLYAYTRRITPETAVKSIDAMMANLLSQDNQLSSLDDIVRPWIRFDPAVELGRRPCAPVM